MTAPAHRADGLARDSAPASAARASLRPARAQRPCSTVVSLTTGCPANRYAPAMIANAPEFAVSLPAAKPRLQPATTVATAASGPAAPPGPTPSAHSQRGLDWLNFFVADVQTAFGPFLAAYLSQHGWTQSEIGSMLTVNTGTALATQMPAGALVDWIKTKRLVLLVCLGLIAGGALLIAFFTSYVLVMAGEIMQGITGGAVRTAMAAIALGLVGHRAYNTRVGRNHRYDSFGNALTAAGMGAVGYFVSARAPFFVAAGLCIPALGALALIRGREIDYARARGATGRKEPKAARWRELMRNRPLLVFAGVLLMFQFANASMLPLAIERVTAEHKHQSMLVTSGMVVVQQVVTAIMALWIARKAQEWGRKPLLLAAFAALLVQLVLYALALGPWYLVGVQVLGGLTAAVIGILNPLIVADVTKGTGRYNFSLGTVGLVQGLGAMVSTTATGFLAQSLGFFVAFAALAVVAGLGFGLIWLVMPETVGAAQSD
jgi:MFS family permease